MQQQPLVSILILNWNGEALLEECLMSLRDIEYAPVEVVVVDNGSTDGSRTLLTSFPEVTVVANKQNYGYARGNNIGIAHCHGKYIATLNNDMTIDPHWLSQPVEHLEAEPLLGFVGCRQMMYQQRDTIDGLFHVVKNDLTFYPFGARRAITAEPAFLQEGYVLSVNGGSSIIRRSMLDDIGCYDERHFAYYDEVDLCLRGFLHGWRAWYCPNAVVYHKGSASFKKTGVFTYFLRERNRLWVLYKFMPLRLLLWRLLPLLLMELRVIRVMCFKMGRPDQFFRARKEAFFGFELYSSERRENLARLKGRSCDFRRLLREGLVSADKLFK